MYNDNLLSVRIPHVIVTETTIDNFRNDRKILRATTRFCSAAHKTGGISENTYDLSVFDTGLKLIELKKILELLYKTNVEMNYAGPNITEGINIFCGHIKFILVETNVL